MQWPIGIVVLLASSVAANVALMRAANDDPAFSVEPDYYKRAVAFDTTMQEVRNSDALGWSANVTIKAGDDQHGILTVQLRDRAGKPLKPDNVQADAFFNARANDVTHVVLQSNPQSIGDYTGTLSVKHLGQWEVRIDARRGNEHFVATQRTDVIARRP